MWSGSGGTDGSLNSPGSSSSNSEDLQGVLQREQKLRPECSFSSSESQSCSMQNGGNYVCETIKSIFRRCPNERPCEIYRQIVKSDDQSLPNDNNGGGNSGIFYSKSWSSSSSGGDVGGNPHDAIEGMFEDAFKIFNGVMGAPGGFGIDRGGSFDDRDGRNNLGPDGIIGEMFRAFTGVDPFDGKGSFDRRGGGGGGGGGIHEGPYDRLPPHVRARIEKDSRKIEDSGENI